MEKITKMGRIFYAVALAAVGIHQLFYADFCNFLFPPWPHTGVGYNVLACLFSVFLITATIAILSRKYGRTVALTLGGLLLLMFLFGQVPFEFIVIPYSKSHLGLWIDPLKETALAGGAFIIAGSYTDTENKKQAHFIIRAVEALVPFGPFLFCFTMVSFGISHFFYAQTVADMVPGWIPEHLFWIYFAAVALIGAGIAITIRIWTQVIAFLLGTMIFLWFIVLHIPRALAEPLADKGNEVTAAFSALAFSGIAFVIARSYRRSQRSGRD